MWAGLPLPLATTAGSGTKTSRTHHWRMAAASATMIMKVDGIATGAAFFPNVFSLPIPISTSALSQSAVTRRDVRGRIALGVASFDGGGVVPVGGGVEGGGMSM